MAALLDAIVGAFRSLFSLRILWLMIWPVLAALVLWAALAFVFWTPLQNLWLWLYDILSVAEWMTGIEPAWIGAALQLLLHLMLFVPLVMLTALVLTAVFGMDAMVRTVSERFLLAGVAAAGVSAIVLEGTLRTAAFIVISPLAGMIMGFVLVLAVMWIARRIAREVVNKWFRKLQLGSSAFYSFTHGSNDAQKGVGIITTVLAIELGMEWKIEFWTMVACGAAISLGTFFGGWRIVKTMASRITKLDPYQGFCAETGAAAMLFVTARFGIPVSTTHTISGGIMGVGATKRLSAVRWGVGRKIVIAWILTIPASATIAGLLFLVVNALGF